MTLATLSHRVTLRLLPAHSAWVSFSIPCRSRIAISLPPCCEGLFPLSLALAAREVCEITGPGVRLTSLSPRVVKTSRRTHGALFHFF